MYGLAWFITFGSVKYTAQDTHNNNLKGRNLNRLMEFCMEFDHYIHEGGNQSPHYKCYMHAYYTFCLRPENAVDDFEGGRKSFHKQDALSYKRIPTQILYFFLG